MPIRKHIVTIIAVLFAAVAPVYSQEYNKKEPRDTTSDKGGFMIYTNAAYLAGLAPNLGTVIHLGKGWAADLRLGGAWWTREQEHFCWRIYGGEVAIRKYFRTPATGKGPWKSLTGHHIGLYAQLFTYDFEYKGSGQIGGQPSKNIFANPQYGAGIEYGYTFALSKRLNLDLGIGAGYMGGLYHNYDAFEEKHIWRSSVQRHWIGPTRADITLQWLFGGAVNQKKKGGRR